MRLTTLPTALAVVWLLAGCEGDGSTGKPVADSPPSAQPEAAQEPDEPREPVNPPEPARAPAAIPAGLYDAARADCAERSGEPAHALEIIRAEAVTWRDGSLGCPEPGMMYAQVLVEGYWLVLTDGRREFDYRGGRGGKLSYCDEPEAGPTPSNLE